MVEPIIITKIVKDMALKVANETLMKPLKEVGAISVKESPVKCMIGTIENSSLRAVKAQNKMAINQIRSLINEKSPFSVEINKFIRDPNELNIYIEANLRESNINGRPSLIRNDIDPNKSYDFGGNSITNLERMKEGNAPLDINNKPIELHHIGQQENSPLAELRQNEHRSNFNVLHKIEESNINRSDFGKVRANYWKERAKMFGGVNA